jgi:oligopeptidase B
MNAETKATPPVAIKKDTILVKHGDERHDPYYWLNERDNPEVVAYLEAENAYRDSMTAHLKDFEKGLFEEMKARIKEDDSSVPYFMNGYFYITRYIKGGDYPIYERKKESLEAEAELMLDVNEMAKPFSYYNVGGLSVSPDNKILCYGEDTLSRRIYTLRFKNLESGEMLEDVIPNTTGGGVWANDNETFFYAQKDETLRSYKIFKHKLGTPASEDQEIFHEKDATFSCYVYKSRDRQYIMIGSFQTLSSEVRYVDANEPDEEFTILSPRERNHEYSADHKDGHWYFRTNMDAKNFRLMKAKVGVTSKDKWEEVIPHRDDVLFEGVDLFAGHMVLSERHEGLTKLRIIADSGDDHMIEFEDEAYVTYTSTNREMDTEWLRIGFMSLTTPNSTIDYNMNTKEKVVKKQQEVVGDFSPENYKSERLMVEVRDGARVPVSIVYHKDTPLDGTSPLLLYGYGSYGASMDPYFSSVRLSLLDRGFVYAIAHIRGGEELGRQWYEDGKLLNKKNTFNDFIDCGKHLIEKKYAAKDQLYCMGGSAGGLLIGAVINQAPELWAGAIAAVPFVDVITTMLDESIPLTTGEYDEWGNPNEEEYYHYIKSYSPYDQVSALNYPPLLVTTGYHDSQVQYWEPAKWVAKMRDMKTGDNPLYMYCNMDTGHGGSSGRFERLKEVAMEYTFLLELAGKIEG